MLVTYKKGNKDKRSLQEEADLPKSKAVKKKKLKPLKRKDLKYGISKFLEEEE